MGSEVYESLDKNWKNTARILFGEELGELKDYEKWFCEYPGIPSSANSSVSGKEVTLGSEEYCADAHFRSLSEVDFAEEFKPLDVNEIKDIDSIVEAVRERVYYTGDIVLGNSKFTEASTNVTESNYVYKSRIVDESEYVANSQTVKASKSVFGAWGSSYSGYLIRGLRASSCQRCFEYMIILNCSDVYYSAGLEGCT
ncbi:MAG: hypothetical protein ABIH99_00800, partial [Candidatus Micrarchaeota archaeon]